MIHIVVEETNPMLRINYYSSESDCIKAVQFVETAKKLAKQLGTRYFEVSNGQNRRVKLDYPSGHILDVKVSGVEYCKEIVIKLSSPQLIQDYNRVLQELDFTIIPLDNMEIINLSKQFKNVILSEYTVNCGEVMTRTGQIEGRGERYWEYRVKLTDSTREQSMEIYSRMLPVSRIVELSKWYTTTMDKKEINWDNPWTELFRWARGLELLVSRIPKAKYVDMVLTLDRKRRHYSGVGVVALRDERGELLLEYSFERGMPPGVYPPKYWGEFADWIIEVRNLMEPRFYKQALKTPKKGKVSGG